MDFIEHRLLDPSDSYETLNHLTAIYPTITPITVEWQKEKCDLLGILFKQTTEQHPTLAGQKLKKYEPWICEDIGADGNCLFRCLSKLISGSEEYYVKLRGEICRYMVYDGKDTIGWYFREVLSTTPADHISTKFMYQSGFWGTDAELMAASALLQTDIYVANSFYKTPESIVREVRWSLIRPSNNNNKTHAIYIDNYNNKHYQPVTKMIDSLTPTFFEPDTTSTII